MSNRETIKIRAPKKEVLQLRKNFPGMTDADIFRVTFNTSLVKFENGLRNFDRNVKKKSKK